MKNFHIETNSIKQTLQQLAAIREFPVVLKIYDRAIVVSNKDELTMLKSGIEIGCYVEYDYKNS